MINTILFDLDGTLLRFRQEDFIGSYFGKLAKVFVRLCMDPEKSIKGVWSGTKAMVENDGGKLNVERFWDTFSEFMKLGNKDREKVESNCDSFYTNEFDAVKEITEPTDIPKRLIPALRTKGFTVALATNPLFPMCAVTTRLRWLGLKPEDFVFVTHYANSRFCKPNPSYFQEILKEIGKKPTECIMVGNNVDEDMIAETLGIDTFLVTDYMENESGADISQFKHGTQAELETYLLTLSV